MRQFIIATCCFFCCCAAHAQSTGDQTNKKGRHKREHITTPPVCYVGSGTGINNPSGFLGFDASIPIAKTVTLDGGAGASTWGNKLFVGAKYYLRPYQRGWAFGGGLTFNSGMDDFKPRLDTRYGRQRVALNLAPQTNIFLGVYHYWTLGRNHNRFYLHFGRSIRLTEVRYTQLAGYPLTEKSDHVLRTIAPGGFMAGLGFSFAIHNRHTNL